MTRFLCIYVTLWAIAGCAVPASNEQPPCRVSSQSADDRVGNAGCRIEAGGKTLLLVHRMGAKLGFPGGTAESGELAQCTAHRETWEETGLDVTVGPFLREFSTGFVLYECSPDTALEAEREPELKPWSLVEVAAFAWRDLDSIEAEEWRFPEQVEEIRGLGAP